MSGTCLFLPDAAIVLPFLADVKRSQTLKPVALEFMDQASLRILKESARLGDAAAGIAADAAAMLYVETCSESERSSESALEEFSYILDRHGVSPDSTWTATEESGLSAMREMRHALPEAVNALVSRRSAQFPRVTKLATDLAVPEASLPEMMQDYRRLPRDAELEHVLFGHIGDSHLHMNIIPRSMDDYERGRAVCLELTRRAVSRGGSVSAEHGIGRLKKHLLAIQFTCEEIKAQKAVKNRLDPDGILNPGVLW